MSDNGSSTSHRAEAGALAQPDAAAARPVASPAGTQFEDAPGGDDAPPHPPHFLSSSDVDRDFDEEEGGIKAAKGKLTLAEDDDDAPPSHPAQAPGEETPGAAAAAKVAVKSSELLEDDEDDDDAPPSHPAQAPGEETPGAAAAAKVAAKSSELLEDDDPPAPAGPTIAARSEETQVTAPPPQVTAPPPPSANIEPRPPAVPMIFRPPPRSMLPPPNDDPQENDEPPSCEPRAPSIPHLEATLVEPDEEATVYSAVEMTPSRWEQHKRCIIAIIAIFFVVFVAVIVSLAIQGRAPEPTTSKPSTDQPTTAPTNTPTNEPTDPPTPEPTSPPTRTPTNEPTDTPTPEPTTASPTPSLPSYSKSILVPPSGGGGVFDHLNDFGFGADDTSNIDKIDQIQIFGSYYVCLATTYILQDGSTSTRTNGDMNICGNPVRTLNFRRNEYISKIEVLWEDYVSHMKICTTTTLGRTTSGECYGPFGQGHRLKVPANAIFRAPSGGVIKALHGRSGDWLDAIGVYYES